MKLTREEAAVILAVDVSPAPLFLAWSAPPTIAPPKALPPISQAMVSACGATPSLANVCPHARHQHSMHMPRGMNAGARRALTLYLLAMLHFATCESRR